MAADIGTGATITFGTSGWSGNMLSVSHNGIGRSKVSTSYLGTVGGRTYIPTDQYEPGELEIEFQVDTTDFTATGPKFPPYKAAAETITFKLPVAATVAAQVAGTGFITTVEYDVPLEELITGRMTVAFSGNLTQADGS